MYMYIHIHIHVYTDIHVHVYTDIHIHVYTHIDVHVLPTLLSPPDIASISPVIDQLACHITSENVFKTWRKTESLHRHDEHCMHVCICKIGISMIESNSDQLSLITNTNMI